MAPYCKDMCDQYRRRDVRSIVESRYASGEKRCSICCVFILWDGLHCPCCGTRLRSRPAASKANRVLRRLRAAGCAIGMCCICGASNVQVRSRQGRSVCGTC